MKNTELLNQLVSKVNREWPSNYKAELLDNSLVVKTEIFNSENNPSWVEAGGINNSLVVFGEDDDVTSQLAKLL